MLRSASFCPGRPSFSTEPASAPNLFGATTSQDCESTGNVILELARLWESAHRNHPTLARATDANFGIHCLFTVIHCSFWRRKIANFPNP